MATRNQVLGWSARFIVCLVALVAFSTPATSQAELLDYSGYAMDGYSGSLSTSGSFFSHTVEVTFQYAVFTAEKFYTAFGASAPSGYTQNVYAYQFVSEVGSNIGISLVTVGLGSGNDATTINEYVDSDNDTAATNYYLNPQPPADPPYTSAVWSYSSSNIPIGGKSRILLFQSPHTPVWDVNTTVKGGMATASGHIPTPGAVPEPMTLASLAVAGLLFISFRRLRQTLFH